MRHVVIGTAGHVDHGKTALVKALTGVDADRLKEEKERELTIDIGFADFVLPSGNHAGVVDVPGHERFVKNMLAGATGMDLVILVVAADEGVMPQTREHLDIVSLLGVRRGVVAITKKDLVDADWLEVVESDIAETVAGTIFDGAPMTPVSSVTGEGLPELVQAIDAATADMPEADFAGPFRVPIDRVFKMAGFGVVVTGTLTRGTIRVEDAAEILSEKGSARVRQIQVWGRQVESAVAGQRVGVNLSRLEKIELERGDIVAQPGSMRPTYLLDTRLQLTRSAPAPLRNRQRVRIHIGTAEILGRAVLLDADLVEPGGEALCQLKLETTTAASRADRFVIRLYSPMLTIGGGVVLDPNPRRHTRYERLALEQLSLTERGSAADRLERAVLQRGLQGAAVAEIAGELQQDIAQFEPEFGKLVNRGRIVALVGSDRLVHADALRDFTGRALSALRDFHAASPLLPAMPKRDLANALRVPGGEAAFDALMRHLTTPAGETPALRVQDVGATLASPVVVAEPGGYRLPEHQVALSPAHTALKNRLAARCRNARFAPPARDDLAAGGPDAQTVLRMLLEEGVLVAVGEFVMHADVLAEAKAQIKRHMSEKARITVSEFRELVGTSRKYAVPLLEHLDRIRFTRRVGDERVLA